MWLYSLLLFISFIAPFALSFDKKLKFFKQWKYVLPSLVFVAFFYIAMDIYFTKSRIWGFNPSYHLPFRFFHLPIEEWLFFIVIPYACIFIHEAVVLYFPGFKLSPNTGKLITGSLILLLFLILILHSDKAYTVYVFSITIIALIISLFAGGRVIDRFYLTFLIILVPFILIDGMLTGGFMGKEVVWYNQNEILNIRLLTIPLEDTAYAFSLILFNLLLIKELERLHKRKYKESDAT